MEYILTTFECIFELFSTLLTVPFVVGAILNLDCVTDAAMGRALTTKVLENSVSNLRRYLYLYLFVSFTRSRDTDDGDANIHPNS
jgi:hypothetical protein